MGIHPFARNVTGSRGPVGEVPIHQMLSVVADRAEVARHFRGLDGLEEDLAFEDFGREEQWQRKPWPDGSGCNGRKCKRGATDENPAERT